MKLSDWLDQERVKRIDFARTIRVSPSYLTQLCDDAKKFWPGRDVAERIRAATNGEVTPNDFLPPLPAEAGIGSTAEAAE